MLMFRNDKNCPVNVFTIYYGEKEKLYIFDFLLFVNEPFGILLKPNKVIITSFDDIEKELTEFILEKLDVEKKVDLIQILKNVSDFTGITMKTLISQSRKREHVDARFIYMSFARKYTFNSLSIIGAEVNRDHSSVLYGKEQVDNILILKKRYKDFELFMLKKGLL